VPFNNLKAYLIRSQTCSRIMLIQIKSLPPSASCGSQTANRLRVRLRARRRPGTTPGSRGRGNDAALGRPAAALSQRASERSEFLVVTSDAGKRIDRRNTVPFSTSAYNPRGKVNNTLHCRWMLTLENCERTIGFRGHNSFTKRSILGRCI
jgi:hypothetical protein